MDIKTYYKATETIQFMLPCYPPGVKYGFIKGEAIRLPVRGLAID